MGRIKINNESGCWLWEGATDGIGRPLTFERGVPVRVQHLHFQQKYGYKAKRIATTCASKFCCNPEHLVDGTKNVAAERLKRMAATMELDDETRKALQQ